MEKSIQQLENENYKITILPNTRDEEEMLRQPLSDIQDFLYNHFDEKVKEEFGENAYISSIIDDSGLPYEICVQINIEKK